MWQSRAAHMHTTAHFSVVLLAAGHTHTTARHSSFMSELKTSYNSYIHTHTISTHLLLFLFTTRSSSFSSSLLSSPSAIITWQSPPNSDGSVVNESVRRNDSLTRTNWTDSPFHFPFRSFFHSHRPVAVLFTDKLSEWWGGQRASQSYAKSRTLSSNFCQWETGNHSKSFHEINKTFNFSSPFIVLSHSLRPLLAFSFSQSLVLGQPAIAVSC